MKVKDIMTKNVVTIKKDNTILDAMVIMKDSNIGFLIVEENNEAIGVFTDRDIIMFLAKEHSLTTTVSKMMKKYVVSIEKDKDVIEASDVMGYMQIRRLVVTENEKICGVISVSDFLKSQKTEHLTTETLVEISYNYESHYDKISDILQISAYVF